ncbi:transporter substrate-binding domain-containing protein [Komagataeibacter diospyri]|uniref:Amino acid ABC transporter permease n=1 Tax=Komagataeibacter diospyri TaxID=1932662 RepID=A0A4P5NQ49_9PROT|nr:transporter substrate-binding domain-containing protein [Komagataeibacter diospyri]GCE82194.1 amino acid ABC transporter permease [Komagataeibacter diospyri]GCE88612.1 amino acid ABC transporter permease [Komagataeibacter diospyri]
MRYRDRAFGVIRALLPVLLWPVMATAAPRQVVIGVYPSYPPLDMRDPETGQLEGFDIDLATALARQNGWALTFHEISFEELLPAVQTGRVDLFFNGMIDNAVRRESVDFVDYLREGSRFLVPTRDAAIFRTQRDLCGKYVAANRTTSQPAQIQQWSAENCSGNDIRFYPAENDSDAMIQLYEGRVQAMMVDSIVTQYVTRREKGRITAMEGLIFPQKFGIGLHKGSTELAEQIRSGLRELVLNGNYKELLDKWGLSQENGLDEELRQSPVPVSQ